jgi:hypothetical protein
MTAPDENLTPGENEGEEVDEVMAPATPGAEALPLPEDEVLQALGVVTGVRRLCVPLSATPAQWSW